MTDEPVPGDRNLPMCPICERSSVLGLASVERPAPRPGQILIAGT